MSVPAAESTIWTPSLQTEISHTPHLIHSSLEKQRQDEGLIRSLRDPKTKRLFALLDVARVCQLDAGMLDEEIIKLLRNQTENVGLLVTGSAQLAGRFRSELELALRCLVWWFSMRVSNASPGEILQNLRYRDERKFSAPHTRGLVSLPKDAPSRSQRFAHLLLWAVMPWAWNRLRDEAVERRWGETPESENRWAVIEALDRAVRVAGLANFLLFLVNGRYRSLTDRLLKLRLVHARNESVRAVSFELINQQLLFDGFSKILLCILPLVDWTAFIRSFGKLKNLIVRTAMSAIPDRVLDLWSGGTTRIVLTSLADESEEACVSCGANPPTMPHRANPCKHVYCYFCLKTLSARGGASACVQCDKTFESAQRM